MSVGDDGGCKTIADIHVDFITSCRLLDISFYVSYTGVGWVYMFLL